VGGAVKISRTGRRRTAALATRAGPQVRGRGGMAVRTSTTSESGPFSSCGDLLLIDENFDPAVASPPARRAVIGNRLARSVGDHTNLRWVDAFLADQVSGYLLGSPLSKLVVIVIRADAVGMPGNNEEAPRRRPGVRQACIASRLVRGAVQ
jgi:hypothetical protein